jgi:hypothetical protein
MSSGSGITRPLRSWLADRDQCLERDRGAATCSLTIAQKSPSNEHDAKCAALGAVVTVLIIRRATPDQSSMRKRARNACNDARFTSIARRSA